MAALMPGATLAFALFESDTEWAGGAAGIVLILMVLAAAAMVLPIALWGVCSAVLLRRMHCTDSTRRVLFVASFAVLFMLMTALPSGPDGGDKLGPAIGQEVSIGVTVLGDFLRQAPWMGFGWLCVITVASYAPPWLGLLSGVLGAIALGFVLESESDRQDSREGGLRSREIRRTFLTGEPAPPLGPNETWLLDRKNARSGSTCEVHALPANGSPRRERVICQKQTR